MTSCGLTQSCQIKFCVFCAALAVHTLPGTSCECDQEEMIVGAVESPFSVDIFLPSVHIPLMDFLLQQLHEDTLKNALNKVALIDE